MHWSARSGTSWNLLDRPIYLREEEIIHFLATFIQTRNICSADILKMGISPKEYINLQKQVEAKGSPATKNVA